MKIVIELRREETFTFTPDNEPSFTIRSGALREFLLARAMHKVVAITFPEQTLDELVEQHGLEQPRLESMTLREASEPVIVGVCENGSNILIDGSHRRYFWAARNVVKLRGWVVPLEVWSQYLFDPTAPGVIAHHADGSLLPHRRK